MTTNAHVSHSSRRKPVLLLLLSAFVLIGLVYGIWWFVQGRHHESTENASVSGNLIRVTPRVAGTVIAVYADDTDYVKQGQLLVDLDDTDARIALTKAEAALGTTVRQVSQAFDLVTERQAAVRLNEEVLRQAEVDFARRDEQTQLKMVSREESEHARSAVTKAKADLQLARAQLSSAQNAVHGASLENHPAVLAAAAQLREAWVAVNRCHIRAAGSGYIAKRSIQAGQQVAVGTPLMALVPLDPLWVDANFKEDQLKRLRLGQPVELTSDIYGGGVVFHGKVAGVAPGTGAIFSLLPPQNATGNWIKIVQRLPVRITLDTKEIAEHPLMVGLSMKVTIDTRAQDGPALATASAGNHYETPVFDDDAKEAEPRIRQIITANRGASQ
ncbi:MAG: efflux RND transporter periplasmic adaptor subunit [Zoogloeaceae bacterium]|jgi:membrane fusion protein (multidrug efflux system)|nr:efflux RND transporter periplasmic adaptor subunit [Zoogloeaceae bacterium]